VGISQRSAPFAYSATCWRTVLAERSHL